jgi:general nucleoside transport system permease protein
MKKEVLRSLFVQIGILLSALFLALLIGGILFIITKANPIKAYSVLFVGPLSSKFGITETLVRAAPLMLVGLGIAISFRSGILNIGGEGQIMVGAITGSAVALALPGLPRFILIPIVLMASFISGGIWGGIAGWMKAHLSVNEILSTIMLNYIATQLYLFLIRGPLIDPQELAYGTGVPQTARLPETAWLTRFIPSTRLHTGIIFAFIMAILVYILLWRTTFGFRMRAVGAEQSSARYAGIKVELYLVLAMLLSGAFAGMAGAVEVLGVHRRAIESISAGYGFSGIVVALFGRLHPLGIIPASFLFGILIIGADMMQRAVDVPAAIILAIQGLIILAVVSSNVLLNNSSLRERIFAKICFNTYKREEDI